MMFSSVYDAALFPFNTHNVAIVTGPRRPMNMHTMSTILLPIDKYGVIPTVDPTVANADVTSTSAS